MRYIKMLLMAVAVTALSACTTTATASTFTSPGGTSYTGPIEMTSTNFELDGSFTTIDCTHSVIKFKVEQHGSVNAGGKATEWYFAGCNFTLHGEKPGSFEFTSSGALRSSGATLFAATSVGNCGFTTNITTIGSLTGGAPAFLDLNSSKIPRTEGNFLCGSSGTLTGSYEVVTPSSLWVE